MAFTTVQNLLDKVSLLLKDETNVRWTEPELLGYLNEAYKVIVPINPAASVKYATISDLVAGKSKQSIPDDAVKLINIHANTGGNQVLSVSKEDLDQNVPNWHAVAGDGDIQFFVTDPAEPKTFYVYPNPTVDSSIEVSYGFVPVSAIGETIALDDIYAPLIIDYMVYQAYLKDADETGDSTRAQAAYQSFMNLLGGK